MSEDDRLTKAFKRLVELFTGRIDYLALYPSKVYSQDPDGSLQVFPDYPRIPKMAGVPLRTPFPQCQVTVAAGTRVLLGFEGGDPSKPYCSLWEGSTGEVTLVVVGSSDDAQYVALSNLVDDHQTAVQQYLDTVTYPTAMGPTGTAIPGPSPVPPGVGCIKFKVE